MKKIIILVCFPLYIFAQKYIIDNSNVTFFSYAPIEDIKAESTELQGVVDFSTKEFFFQTIYKFIYFSFIINARPF